MSDNKELAIRPTAIVTSGVTECADLAKRFAQSTLIPEALRGKEADVFVTLLAGQELGLSPMASLRAIHVVKGRPILSADTMVALVLGRGAAAYFRCIEESDERATYETLRVGAPEPQRATWTIADARRAGLTGGNWTSYPRAMLKARCKASLARDVYPDVLAGCYDESEREEVEARPPTITRVHGADALDVEFTDAPPDAWSAFCAELAPVAGCDATAWSVEDAVACVSRQTDGLASGALRDALRPWSAVLARAGRDERIDRVRDACREIMASARRGSAG